MAQTETSIQDAPALARLADPSILVIFGAGGDLTRRKLVPALYNLRRHRLLPDNFAIVGVARKEGTDESFREQLSQNIREFATSGVDDDLWAFLRDRIYYSQGDFTNPATYLHLAERLPALDALHGTSSNYLFYLATPPDSFAEIVRQLGAAGLTKESQGSWRRVIVEKPFGHDLDSARALNQELRSVLQENQIYRIDHYLGKETVQNILVFRFANGLFEPTWNRRYIDHIQIMVAETLGMEGRGATFDRAGILRDIIQNHMFQLLCLVAMEPPISFDPEAVRDEKVKVLKAIRPMKPEEVIHRAVRGQYGEGFIGKKKVPAYRQEEDVPPDSPIETYGALQLLVENWRWAGIPFYLRSGKRLPKRTTEIMIQFRRPPLLLFEQMSVDDIGPNRLVLRIQPDEGMAIHIKAKLPGPTIRLNTVRLNFAYGDLGEGSGATGYERLLYDAMLGDSTLFHRADMVEEAWKIATPILDVWGSLPPRDFPNYPAGTWGPQAADQLIERDSRRWWRSD